MPSPCLQGASSLNGTVNASRIITSPVFSNIFDVFIDSHDTMYVVNSDGGPRANQINVFASAATRNGAVMPDVTAGCARGGGAEQLSRSTQPATGTSWIEAGRAVYGYDNVATRNGTIPPDRTLKGSEYPVVRTVPCVLARVRPPRTANHRPK